jgi:hypothetical protein
MVRRQRYWHRRKGLKLGLQNSPLPLGEEQGERAYASYLLALPLIPSQGEGKPGNPEQNEFYFAAHATVDWANVD